MRLYFQEKNGYEKFFRQFGNINLTKRDGVNRHLAILVNPISGKGRARSYFDNILRPMLDIASLKYTKFETQSSTYVSEWISELNFNEMEFTEFVMIGGDGLLSQFLNSVSQHPDKDLLFKLPIGIVPGGSTNATSCDLSGKSPFMAALN